MRQNQRYVSLASRYCYDDPYRSYSLESANVVTDWIHDKRPHHPFVTAHWTMILAYQTSTVARSVVNLGCECFPMKVLAQAVIRIMYMTMHEQIEEKSQRECLQTDLFHDTVGLFVTHVSVSEPARPFELWGAEIDFCRCSWTKR